MEYQFFDPSEKALAHSRNKFERKYNFPFDLVPLGKSFPVGKDDVSSLATLRTMASREGIKLKRKFKVIDHGDNGFEVFYVEVAV